MSSLIFKPKESISALITNTVYKRCLALIIKTDDEDKIRHWASEIRYALALQATNAKNKTPHHDKLVQMGREVSDLYLSSLCELPDTVIQLIIDEHTAKILKREDKTIQALIGVLAERAMLKQDSEIISSTEKNINEAKVEEVDSSIKPQED